MAVVVANAAVDPVELFNYFHSYNLAISPKARIGNDVRITLAPNEFVDFSGNFTFHPQYPVLPIGGTLNSIKVIKDGVVAYSVTGLNLGVLTGYSFTSPIPGAGQELGLLPIALAGNDTGTGSNFVDKLDGYTGNDTISGRGGNDTIDGMTGHDTLRGDAGSDIVKGGTGNDSLNGGLGNDRLTGGAGNDNFVSNRDSGAEPEYRQCRSDCRLQRGQRYDQLDNAIFKGLAGGPLKAAAFKLGSAATDPSDRINYNRATGDFFFDANGSVGPSTNQVKFAHLDKAAGAALFPAVTAADLFVI